MLKVFYYISSKEMYFPVLVRTNDTFRNKNSVRKLCTVVIKAISIVGRYLVEILENEYKDLKNYDRLIAISLFKLRMIIPNVKKKIPFIYNLIFRYPNF